MAAIGLGGAGAVAFGVAAALLAAGGPPAVVAVPVTVVLVGGALVVGMPRLAYRHWWYRIDDGALVLRHGVIFRTESSIPYFRVQHVDVEQGPIERACGLSRLIVRTASATTDATVPGLADVAAADLRRLILERAGRGDAV